MLSIKHVLTGKQFSAESQLELFRNADALRNGNLIIKSLESQRVLLIFGEPSTRTRLSFEIAVKRLGGDAIIIDNLEEKLSVAKDEGLEDTVKTCAALGIRIIAIRHREKGLPALLAKISDRYRLGISIINAGDGNHEHPTQALLDVYTVWRERRKELENGELVVAYLGDIKDSRVAHSGKSVFSAFGVKVITPPSCLKAADQIDVWNLLRFQKERKKIQDIESAKREYYQKYTLTEEVRRKAKSDALFLHSRPRGPELPAETDEDPRQRYIINFRFSDPWQNQETNGLYLRMAILIKILEGEK